MKNKIVFFESLKDYGLNAKQRNLVRRIYKQVFESNMAQPQQQVQQPQQQGQQQQQQQTQVPNYTPGVIADTINQFQNTEAHDLKISELTDGICDIFDANTQYNRTQNDDIVFVQTPYISENYLINYMTNTFKCTPDEAALIINIMTQRNFIVETTSLNTSLPELKGMISNKYYIMTDEMRAMYNNVYRKQPR